MLSKYSSTKKLTDPTKRFIRKGKLGQLTGSHSSSWASSSLFHAVDGVKGLPTPQGPAAISTARTCSEAKSRDGP